MLIQWNEWYMADGYGDINETKPHLLTEKILEKGYDNLSDREKRQLWILQCKYCSRFVNKVHYYGKYDEVDIYLKIKEITEDIFSRGKYKKGYASYTILGRLRTWNSRKNQNTHEDAMDYVTKYTLCNTDI